MDTNGLRTPAGFDTKKIAMQATKKRRISRGNEFDYLFPTANRDTHTIMKSAEVSDTVAFIPKVVNQTLSQTARLGNVLKGNNEYETCRNIWEFVYRHIAYNKDRDGYEQIRSPARTWHDRSSGVDCDCYTTFISSVLTNLKIRHKLRITKYSHDYFQHIYPIALLKNGRQVAIDCVTEQFDYEVPYSEKKDYPMELQFLDGIEGAGASLDSDLGSELGENLNYAHEEEGLGKHKHKHKNKKSNHEDFDDFMQHGDEVPGYGVRKKKGIKKLFNFINKLNPATVLLRNGVLASSKLNIGRMGGRIRWTYLTPNQARAKGMDMGRWEKLVKVRQKLDNIYYGAGGKPENLKKAILKGKGNKDKSVHGLDEIGEIGEVGLIEGMGNQNDYSHPKRPISHPDNPVSHPDQPIHEDDNAHEYTKDTPLKQLLGADIYHSEHEGLSTLGELGDLGEPVTMAAVASASGVVAAIVKMLKKVGDVFGGKGKGSSDFADHPDDNVETNTDGEGTKDGGSKNDGDNSETGLTKTSKDQSTETDGITGGNSGGGGVKGFIGSHKKWIVPAAIGIGGITAIGLGIHAFSGKKKPNANATPVNGLAGKKHHKSPFTKGKKHKGRGKGKKKHGKLTAKALV